MSSRSGDLHERAGRVLPGGNTRSTVFVPPHPPYAVSGRGCIVRDADGNEVYDCNNNYTSLLHGHAHPDIIRAASAALTSGTAFGLPTEAEIELAEILSERTGVPLWRFCNSGTEAVTMAIRAARAATGRDRIIRFHGSYHGTGNEVVDPTTAGVPRSVASDVLVLPQGDATALRNAIVEHRDDVAAILIDLMPNRAGLRPVTTEFASLVRHLATDHEIVLIVDEVITFRLGIGGLRSRYGIDADLTTVGKIIGGGFPVGAVGGTPEVLRSFNPTANGRVSWGGTFSANPVSMRAGQTALRLFAHDEMTRLNKLGDLFREELASAGLRVNGAGSLSRLILDDYQAGWWKLYEAGVLVGTNGLLALSTPMQEEDVATIANRVIGAMSSA
ncbi:aspartate aminotransferase family protein [Saccharopolyspora hattusasensis]|uniref:aspartate aminotransferase family protein n=1 Tax=Saccharopolyspora hattusasensis TaxID=1128679 RepID=UPI003D980D2F